MPQLVITDAKGGEQTVQIGAGEYVLGRDTGIAVTLADKKVSRKHAKVFARGGEHYVEDLGSANGVLVGGQPITQAYRLVSGADFQIGPFRVRFVGDDAATGAPTFSLVGLTHPVSEQTFILPQGDLEVGRGENNAIVIADASLSRRHAVLQVTPSGVIVEDMDSSNGTYVNGTKVGRRALQHGDRIRFGSVELELASSDGASPRRLFGLSLADRSVQLAVGMGAVAMLLLALTIAIVLRRQSGGPGAAMPMEEIYEQQILLSVNAANEHMRRQSWELAFRAYVEVLERDPLNAEARRGLAEAEANREHAQRLDTAKRLIAGSKPDEALRVLQPISGKAFFAAAAAQLAAQARAAVAARSLGEARDACKRREYKTCHDSAVLHLDAEPSSAEGRNLLGEAERELRARGVPFTPWLPPLGPG